MVTPKSNKSHAYNPHLVARNTSKAIPSVRQADYASGFGGFSFRMSFAGTPPTSVQSSISPATTAPPAIIQPRPMVTPGRINAFAPIHTSFPISIFFACDPPLRRSAASTSCVSVQRQAPGPIRTRSPMVTGALSYISTLVLISTYQAMSKGG